MLRSAHELLGYRIHATDGNLGKVHDFLLDDQSWAVRYIVVDTGFWMPNRQVLISPVEAGQPRWSQHVLPVTLTRQQVEDSPLIEAHLPVSRQHELRLVDYYGWPTYWGPTGPVMADVPVSTAEEPPAPQTSPDPHLRSMRELRGYHLCASDGQIGHVADFIVDTESWTVRYVIVDRRNWLPGKKVLLAAGWIENVDWANRLVHADLPREEISNSPPFDPAAPVNRAYEQRLYDYYGRPAYWQGKEEKQPV